MNGCEIVVYLCPQLATWKHVNYLAIISGIHGKGTLEGGNKGIYHSFQSVPYSDSIVTSVC